MADNSVISQEAVAVRVTDEEAVRCATPREQVTVEQVPEAPTNATVRAHGAAPLPSTLQELIGETNASAPRLLQHFWRVWDLMPGLPNRFWYGAALSEVRYARQLHPDLPPTLDSAKHVFVVTAPHHGWPVSWRHWSIYSQGHFYHLSADVRGLKPTEQSNLSGLGFPKKDVEVKLKAQDFTGQNGESPDVAEAKASKKPFIAFEVGQTLYTPSEIEEKGDAIRNKRNKYDLLEANCQIFTQEMLEQIVMAKRDCSVFVGTTAQLVAWDLHGRFNPDGVLPNSRATGFLIRKPTLPTSRSMSSIFPFYFFRAANMTKAEAIRILYEDGHLAPGAHDPSGEDSALGYVWDCLEDDLRGAGRDLKRATREFGEDIAAGKWGAAFRGREEYRQERKALLKEESDNGRKFTGIEKAVLEISSSPRAWIKEQRSHLQRSFVRSPAAEETNVGNVQEAEQVCIMVRSDEIR